MKTYSVLIAWDDNDEEAGDYGATVRARDEDEAEEITRNMMRDSHRQNFDNDGEEHIQEDGTFGGRLIECVEGAIWKAKALEDTLRCLVSAARGTMAQDSAAFDDAVKLLNEIEAGA